MTDDATLDQVLGAVGPRLRALRQERGATLAQLAETTGISSSTLSRLESGQRRPTLELLLLLASAHQVPLDRLVDAPATGDPRLHLKPFERGGMTFIPLTKRPGGVQAFKQILPPRNFDREPEPKVHEGYEWMYVLSGRIRLVLGARDFVLSAGEVAEFDTRVPHWFGNPGPGPAELLSLYGPQGERMHVRAQPTTARPEPPNPRVD